MFAFVVVLVLSQSKCFFDIMIIPVYDNNIFIECPTWHHFVTSMNDWSKRAHFQRFPCEIGKMTRIQSMMFFLAASDDDKTESNFNSSFQKLTANNWNLSIFVCVARKCQMIPNSKYPSSFHEQTIFNLLRILHWFIPHWLYVGIVSCY